MKITITSKGTYGEEGQPNPMRWMILTKEDDNSYKNETSWLRCKDFFNDFVYARHTKKYFNIYGFDTNKMNVGSPGEPVYMLLDVLTKQFLYNMDALNTWLKEDQKMPWIPYTPHEGKVLLQIPSIYFDNTYNISLLSLIIRLLNVEHEFKWFKEVITYKEFPEKDQQKWDQVVKKKTFFKLPEDLKKYIWYAGPTCNSIKEPEGYQVKSLVHNNGVLSWGHYFK